jgi:hypothetical protein
VSLPAVREYKSDSVGQYVALFFVIIAFLLLLFLLAALACGIACSGSDGLAILVFLLGLTLLIFLLVHSIKGIFKNKPADSQIAK